MLNILAYPGIQGYSGIQVSEFGLIPILNSGVKFESKCNLELFTEFVNFEKFR